MPLCLQHALTHRGARVLKCELVIRFLTGDRKSGVGIVD